MNTLRGAECGVRGAVHGGRVVHALLLALLATAVVPPAGAWGLNRYRVEQTRSRAEGAVVALRERLAAPLQTAVPIVVACGPGRMPDAGPTGQWVSRAIQAPQLFGEGMPTDGWGRCFLLNIGALERGGPVWVMSAGPNGRIETYSDAEVLAGDDIGVRVR